MVGDFIYTKITLDGQKEYSQQVIEFEKSTEV